ncbi:MAG: ABC transporter permease [Calditrichaceae bacterium]
MKNLLRIARWEYNTRIRARSFLFNTFISPLLFTAIITLPIFFFQYQPEVSTKLIGLIDLSGENIEEELQTDLNNAYRLKNGSPEYMILQVSLRGSQIYNAKLKEQAEIKNRRDSISVLYEDVKTQRNKYFRNRSLRNRANLLQSSYDRLQFLREEKELADIELERFNVVMDSVYKQEAFKMADSLLITDVLNAYLFFPDDFLKTGEMQYHSKNPGDFLETDRFSKLVQTIITERRIIGDEVERSKIREWLKPVHVKRYQLFPEGQTEWNFYIQFYGPVIGVFLLFMAIFTSGGYLFSSVLLEKSNRVIEVLLSYATSRQIMGGKILGLGGLGLTQVLIWFGLTALIMSTNIIPVQKINYLTVTNGLYFLLYFSLGFLFYGAIFIAVGSLSANEYDAQQINQFLRTVAIFPVLLSLMVLAEPNSQLIKILSYIPFLTPSFMIMRIPISSYPITTDIYITTAIMIVSIVLVTIFSGKIFRVATLMQGKKPTWSEIMYWLKASSN